MQLSVWQSMNTWGENKIGLDKINNWGNKLNWLTNKCLRADRKQEVTS